MAREPATVTEVVSGDIAFEVDRFEWTAPDRLEVTGRWYGLRGHRFVRPVLTAEGEDGPLRMLALLDHKPWAADDGEPWIAAFPWDGEPAEIANVELAVAPSLEVDLPAPKPPGRRRKPAGGTSRQARRGAAAKPKPEEPAPDPDEIAALRARLEGEQQAVRRLAAELDEAHARLAVARSATADATALERERDAAISERDEARARTALDHDAVKEERDAALNARAAAEQERDEALDARSAAQFEIRTALAERDAAIAERDRATAGHRAAVRELEALQRRLKAAESPAPAAVEPPPPEPAVRAEPPVRASAPAEPAVRPGTPLRRPFREQSTLVVWGQRLAAVIVLIVWAIVVYKVLHGVV